MDTATTADSPKRAISALKSYFSEHDFTTDRPHDFEVLIEGTMYPVGGDEDKVSECFQWEAKTDDGFSRQGTPRSEEDAETAARLVLANIDKTGWEPQL